MVNPNRFYTYAYLRVDRTPYYIGKGCRNRIYDNGGRQFKPPKDKTRIIFLKQNLTEEEAFKHEIYMITVFGRKDLGTGILHNRTNGGDGASGVIFDEETRLKLSAIHKGKIVSEETKRKMSEAHKGKTISSETRKKLSDVNKGKTLSEETKAKMSAARKNIPRSEETKRKISESRKGIFPSDESRAKMSESQKRRIVSDETKAKISAAAKNMSDETKQKLREATLSQRWKCLETGYISNAGALSCYQKARGIDKSQRVRVE